MKIRNKLIGIIAILIVILFIGMSAQPAVTPNTTQQTVSASSISVKEQKAYDNHFISNPVNTSDQFSNAFISWMINKEHANPYNGGNISKFHMNSNLDMKVLLPQFLSSNPSAVILLQKITAQENAKFVMQNNPSNQHMKLSTTLAKKIVKYGSPIKYINTSTVTSKGTFYDHSVLYKATFNGTQFEVWKVNVTTPRGSIIDPWVWVNINYYVYHAPWYLGGWSLTYGESDNFNVKFTGSAAQSFFNNWENIGSDMGYGLGAAGLFALFIPIPLLTQAIGAALILVGIGSTYESQTMLNYYQSTGNSYIHLDFINNYFYPWITLDGTFASSISLIGISGGSTSTFWYGVPLVLYAGILGVTFSASISSVDNTFIRDYGSGNRIWFS
ncbi:MAG: hypothetical protein ACYDAO_01275 [Thermoplasmataceae archaeon]